MKVLIFRSLISSFSCVATIYIHACMHDFLSVGHQVPEGAPKQANYYNFKAQLDMSPLGTIK